MKTGIIFDMDGTLWDSSDKVALSWTERAHQLGYTDINITKEDMMGVMGMTMDKLADILFADIPASERMHVLDECGEYENAYLEKHGGMLYPRLEETLAKLSEKYPLYIVSNCQSGYIEAFLTHYGFGKYFEDIECYGNNLKEKWENIALIMERNSIEKAWYVGDIQGDCDSALKAGAGFIHASYGFGTIAQDVPFIRAFSELPDKMAELAGD